MPYGSLTRYLGIAALISDKPYKLKSLPNLQYLVA